MRARLHTLALLVCGAGAAAASEEYPSIVAAQLSLPYVPACSLCHVGGKTGAGTARTPFGWSMRARGLKSGDVALVAPALDALQRDRVDSDGDGVEDVRELLAGTDPNVAGGSSFALRADPAYGCNSGGSASLLPLVVALIFAARRSAIRRRRLGTTSRFG
jgi:hypothetical protein